MAKPFESRIQDLVYNVDAGVGHRIIKGVAFFLVLFVLMVVYTATQFKGLDDPLAMDQAQLGRNLMEHGRLITQNVRPASMWYLMEKSPHGDHMINAHPDIMHPPVYPALLAGWFWITRAGFSPDLDFGQVFPAEYNIVALNHIFTLLTALMLFLIARRMFDGRVALLGVILFFLSDSVWADSLSGTGLSVVTFWATAAFYYALITVTNIREREGYRSWVVPMAVSLVLCVLAFLTRYGAVVLVPGLALFYGFSLGRKGWIWASLFIVAFLIGVAPWLARNQAVSGGLLGLAPYTALNDTPAYEADTFERSLHPRVDLRTVWVSLRSKFMVNSGKYYAENIRLLGDGLLTAFFLTTFFFRFARQQVHVFRWAMAFSILILIFIAGFFGSNTIKLMNMFWPMVILYGAAFFMILLDRLQLRARILNIGVSAAMVMLSALPILFTLMPPRANIPYPPYLPVFITQVSNMLEPQELMSTDMPWATAWYGNRNSLHVPHTLDEFYEINDFIRPVRAMYFTQVSRNQPYLRVLRTGRYSSWYMIHQGQIPDGFPLTQGFTLPRGQLDQIFLSDRQRW